jgi:hypothetical protein
MVTAGYKLSILQPVLIADFHCIGQLAGIASSAPMTLVGGTLSDIWSEQDRGVPMAIFSATVL